MNGVVTVNCSDAKHAGEVVHIDTFRKLADPENSDGRQWVGDAAVSTTHSAATEQHQSTYSARVDGDGHYYVVYRLHCSQCTPRRSVPAGRDRLWSALDAVDVRHDEEIVELALLAAIVSKQ